METFCVVIEAVVFITIASFVFGVFIGHFIAGKSIWELFNRKEKPNGGIRKKFRG